MTVTYDPEKQSVELIADCPKGATGVKAYKDGKYFGPGYIVGDKISKTLGNITMKETRTEHVYTFGLSALFGDIESEIATVEFVVPLVKPEVYIYGMQYLNVKCVGNVSKLSLRVDGEIKGNAPVDESGNGKLYAMGNISRQSVEVLVEGYGEDETKKVAWAEVVRQEPTMTLDPTIVGENHISGSYSTYIENLNVYVNGELMKPDVKFNEDESKFSFVIPANLSINDDVEVEGLSASNDVITARYKVEIVSNLEIEK
ncbi:immunoglobulin-like domain-containing protein [Enterococcus faecalis]|uniref:immunoglobulin-like domain-containing protein n=1 Tax=Enterococcus faecalis TaxID=1351 RepID=UPI002955881B|nr:immunoglobulin-like domain-containing protein [Enterococcus faecalis]MDV7868166.1 hypothetical protein [Enterococcus faecalis]